MNRYFAKAIKEGDLTSMMVLFRMLENKTNKQKNTIVMVIFGRKKDRGHIKEEFNRKYKLYQQINQRLAYMTNTYINI